MAITRTSWVDDDGSGTTGTVINNAEKTLLYDQIDAALIAGGPQGRYTEVNSTATGTVNNWAPGLNGHTVIFWNGSANLTINSVAGGVSGQIVTIKNTTAGFTINLTHGTGAGDQLINYATSAPTPLGPGGSASYQYQAGICWRLVAHDQGAWLTPEYSAANFVGSGGTWTVEAADVPAFQYRLSGRALTIGVYVTASSVTGGTQLAIKIPGGFTSAGQPYLFGPVLIGDGAANVIGEVYTVTNGTDLNVRRVDLGAFSATTNNTTLKCLYTFPVN